MIREADASDILDIVRLGSQSLIDGPYAGMLKDAPEQSAKLALQVIQGSGKVLLLENEEKKVVGLLGFVIFPHYFTGRPTANEVMWYVLPEERKGAGGLQLLWRAEQEAKKMGATHMAFTAPNADIGRLYEKFGYKQVEVSFQKEL